MPRLTLLAGLAAMLLAAAAGRADYAIGSPVTVDVWVDRVHGDDDATGATRATALRTVAEAWRRIPMASAFGDHGYRIRVAPGTYAVDAGELPGFWESRWGTAEHPVWIEAADGRGTVTFDGGMDVFDCRYLYLVDLVVTARGGDVLHFAHGDHLLLRRVSVRGQAPATYAVQEGLKVNQAQHVFVEDSDVSGAWDNAVDFVAVQHGEVLRNRVHDSGDWCMYAKGGSADLRIAGNEIFDCGTGGFTAGQGTGFEYMVSPWLHYEAYDVRFVDNVVHDVDGAALGVHGGYDILFAYNTCYRIGARSHLFEAGFGERSCDGDTATCAAHQAAGGWGDATIGDGTNAQPIPNRNVYVYDNVFYNPAGLQSQWQHLAIDAPRVPAAGTHIASPARADDRLVLRGNVFWNGPPDHPLGLGDDTGCGDDNPTCNAAQLAAENAINRFEPELVDPAHGDFHPRTGGALFSAAAWPPDDFPGGDRPQPPLAPAGDLVNAVPLDRDGVPRTAAAPPGAYTTAGATAGCTADAATLCVHGGRFAVRVAWRTAATSGTGTAVAIPGADDSGLFWFFAPTNLEMLVKVLDGCGLDGHYWIFAAATTDVGFDLVVTDTATGTSRMYTNPRGQAAAPIQDTRALAVCP